MANQSVNQEGHQVDFQGVNQGDFPSISQVANLRASHGGNQAENQGIQLKFQDATQPVTQFICQAISQSINQPELQASTQSITQSQYSSTSGSNGASSLSKSVPLLGVEGTKSITNSAYPFQSADAATNNRLQVPKND